MPPQSSFPVRDFSEDWSYFLYEFCQKFKGKARCHINHIGGDYEPYWSSKPKKSCGEDCHNGIDSLVHQLYLIGRDLYKLPVSYQQFYDWFIHDKWFYGEEDYRARVHTYRNRKGYLAYYRSRGPWRTKRSYVRREHHEAKELDEKEQSRREWRAKKKDRDYRKKQRSDRAKQLASEIATPHIRARNKQLLKKEDYDEISDEYDKTYWKKVHWGLS
jgi:hypothetical protein